MKKDLPERKRMRLEGYDYSKEGYYFITICAKDRRCIFGKIVPYDGNNNGGKFGNTELCFRIQTIHEP